MVSVMETDRFDFAHAMKRAEVERRWKFVAVASRFVKSRVASPP